MSRRKGNQRERQCRALYERAGYTVQRSVKARYGEKDMFNEFDFLAVRPDSVVFGQVKSNSTGGALKSVGEWAGAHAPPTVEFHVQVCHDREGWRILEVLPGDHGGHETLVDERDMACRMGEGAAAALRARDGRALV